MGGLLLECRVCGALAEQFGVALVMRREVRYYECPACGYVQTEYPHWLQEAYGMPLNDSDTGIMVRNIANVKCVIATLLALHKTRAQILDYAGGIGILVRLLRDAGINALWFDPHCKNVVARGFEYQAEPIDFVTCFEAFEHFLDPAAELDRMLSIAPTVLLSTLLIPTPAPPPGSWWYYGLDHGQHIGFFRKSTLQTLAHERGKFLYTNGVDIHLISDQKLSKLWWLTLVKLKLLIPFYTKVRLSPLTLEDHLLAASKSSGTDGA